jgi:hypothetical protein
VLRSAAEAACDIITGFLLIKVSLPVYEPPKSISHFKTIIAAAEAVFFLLSFTTGGSLHPYQREPFHTSPSLHLSLVSVFFTRVAAQLYF